MDNTQAVKAYSWKDYPELMARLSSAQNEGRNLTRDVMTFAGFCESAEALERHVEACEAAARD